MESLDEGGQGAALTPVEAKIQDDRALAAALLERDRKATAEFIVRYTDPIYLYVRSRLIPRTDLVDDLVQDIFVAAWENLARYRGDSPLGSWLHGIARHKVENYYRACLRAPLPLDEESQDSAAAVVEPDLDGFLDRDRLQKKTWKVLAGLPEAYSLALLWRYWEQCSAQEMAMRTGKTQKAIERLLARAREMFRERWSHE